MSSGTWHAIGLMDARSQFVCVSDATSPLLGGGSVAVGGCFAELLAGDDRHRFSGALAELLEHADGPHSARLTVAHPAEATYALECRLVRMRGASSLALALLELRPLGVLASDVAAVQLELATEDADAREALQRMTAELQAILLALPDLFFRLDAEGRFLDFSAPQQSELYAPPSFFVGKHPREVIPPELAQSMEEVRASAHRTGTLATLEYELEVGGKLQHFEARYVPLTSGQTIALIRNVTEARHAELALHASEARLRESQKLDAVGRLAGGVAHDLNNLLMIILGYTNAIARHVGSHHAAASAVAEIDKAVERATALTKQLLALSRRQSLQPTVLDIGNVLREMGGMLARVIGEHISLSTQIAPRLACVLADRSKIEQVILNLVLNARDAMPDGGRLTLRAENVPARDVSVPDQVALSVVDSGTGMDAATQARIFEPFFTTKARGTGLGLYTTRQIIDEFNGTIEVVSSPNAGTTLVVRLLAVYAPAAANVVAFEGRGPMSGGSERLLVVEDEDSVRTLLVELLKRLGYDVIAASNPVQALERLHEGRKLDLLLTDIVMPGGSGWELATRVLGVYPDCRVLYMSGHPLPSEQDVCSRVRQSDLLHKPFAPATLASRIRQLLERGS